MNFYLLYLPPGTKEAGHFADRIKLEKERENGYCAVCLDTSSTLFHFAMLLREEEYRKS